MTNQQKLKKLYALLDEIEAYGRCLGKVNFDMECCAPEEGIEKAGEDMAILGGDPGPAPVSDDPLEDL